MAEDLESALIGEQLRHATDVLRGELRELRGEVRHYAEMADQRLSNLEEQGRDHETRLRAATEGVTQFKMWSGLANGGSWLVSLAALIRAWLGGS